MGRQIAIILARSDEEELLELAHQYDAILVSEQLRGPDLLAQQFVTIPRDEVAEPWDYGCCLIPRKLAVSREAILANAELSRPYAIGVSDLPSIEWGRTRPKDRLGYQPHGAARLYMSTDRKYHLDEAWMSGVVDLYDALVTRVKKLTVKVQDGWPRYVSKQFPAGFFESAGLQPTTNGWINQEYERVKAAKAASRRRSP
jgi:hypothetical protein